MTQILMHLMGAQGHAALSVAMSALEKELEAAKEHVETENLLASRDVKLVMMETQNQMTGAQKFARWNVGIIALGRVHEVATPLVAMESWREGRNAMTSIRTAMTGVMTSVV